MLFPEDVQAITGLLQQQIEFDFELMEACWQHIELEQYDVAVFKAFRILEGRVQHLSGIEGEGAAKTLGAAFSTRGPLTRKMGISPRQAANLRDLLRSAFAVFRNPEARPQEAIVEYGSAECKALLSFVNLILGILDRQPEEPLDTALKQIRKDIGTGATERLAAFLARIETLDLKMVKRKTSFSFRAPSLRRKSEGDLRRGDSTVLYLSPGAGNPRVIFSRGLSEVVGLDFEPYERQLRDLGCVEGWAGTQLDLSLREHNSSMVFERLFTITRNIMKDMNRSLTLENHE